MSSFFDTNNLINILSALTVFLLCMPAHEYAHARVATAFGDDTPFKAGRLTLNPFAHIDIVGTLALLVFRFGWAKPVPVNFSNFKRQRLGRALTSVAGPLTNVVIGFIFFVITHILAFTSNIGQNGLLFLNSVAIMNVWLSIINLLPFLPFDGGQFISAFLPGKVYYKVNSFFQKYQGIFAVVFLLLFYTGVLSVPLQIAAGWLVNLLNSWSFKLVSFFF